jgi:hypothetical protein
MHNRSPDLHRLREHSFAEISLDFVWMPQAYIFDTVLKEPFYSKTLPFLSELLINFRRLYIPATLHVFEGIAQNWRSLLSLYLLRYIREDQVDKCTIFQATMGLPMAQLGKESAHFQIAKFELSYEES